MIIVRDRLRMKPYLHSIKLAGFVAFVALPIGRCSFGADPAPRELPAQVAKKAALQSKLVKQLWDGKGKVVVGKLEIPPEVDPRQIASRTMLLNDGWFAARLYAGRTLTFRAHG